MKLQPDITKKIYPISNSVEKSPFYNWKVVDTSYENNHLALN
jgi:hypothetical protein